MNREALGRCPVCGEELYVTKLSCPKCHTTIEGNFILCKFCKLTNEQKRFVEIFLKNRGNIREIEKELMRQHKQVLLEKLSQIKRMIHSVDRILNDEFDVSMLRDFDKKRIEAVKRVHANEIRVLMENSFFLPIVKSLKVFNKLSKSSVVKSASKIINMDFGKLITLAEDVIQRFRKAMKDGPDSLAAKEAVAAYKEFIQLIFPCDDKTFRSIGQAYLEHKNELDEKMPGLAEFVSAAIRNAYP